MQFSTSLAIISALFTSSLAAPATPVTPGATVAWDVAKFNLVCSDVVGGPCYYSFDIASDGSQGPLSSFSTSCSGTVNASAYLFCEDTDLKARVLTEYGTDLYKVFADRSTELTGTDETLLYAGNSSFAVGASGVINAKSYGQLAY